MQFRIATFADEFHLCAGPLDQRQDDAIEILASVRRNGPATRRRELLPAAIATARSMPPVAEIGPTYAR
jgi:hypothetical protein